MTCGTRKRAAMDDFVNSETRVFSKFVALFLFESEENSNNFTKSHANLIVGGGIHQVECHFGDESRGRKCAFESQICYVETRVVFHNRQPHSRLYIWGYR